MSPKDIYELLQKEFTDKIKEFNDAPAGDKFIIVDKTAIYDIAMFLRDDERTKFDYLTLLSGMDYKDTLGVVYHLYSVEKKHNVVIKAILEKKEPTLHTVERIWKAANWHEREAFDMFGIKFENHPNLIRILSPYDWEGHPLLKDYVQPEIYHGMKVAY